MRISEISTPVVRNSIDDRETPLHHQLQNLLSQIESKVKQIETYPPANPVPDSLPSEFRQILTQLTQLAAPLPNSGSLNLHLWKLSYRLWNACVDLTNAAAIGSKAANFSAENVAKLRHAAADMLSLAIDVPGVPSPAIKSAFFYYKTGIVWHDLRNFDLAFTCFERATDLVARLDINTISDIGVRKLLLDLNIARSRTAWEVLDRNLALTLLGRSRSLLFGFSDHYKALANQYFAFAKSVLSTNETNDALKLMNEALDLCEKGSPVARTREEAAEIKELRLKTLRFISAVHLQKGEYESVIKCVKVLRETCDGGDNHASLPLLAMKAWLGLQRYNEAEKELRDMVANKGIPESVWVSAVEAYFQAAGTTGAETATGVFLGLLGRCHASARAALRVTHRLVGDDIGGYGWRIKLKAVVELVSDERLVALFDGQQDSKERKAMHTILWNCASDIFRLNDYETSAEMFEKSILYIPTDMENRILRAKGFRTLCLCCLGTSQLDRAQEYVNEAEKLDPNIACAFLKFKIYLQKNDNSSAINQIEAMTACLDFTPEFLPLSAHEAVACHALAVAAACLSSFHSFYSTGKTMQTAEAVVLRNLVTILTQDLSSEANILKFLKQAHTRASELGQDCFFGKGEIGRREKKWFAVSSWNNGTKSGKEKKYELCVEFFKLAAGFYSFLFEEQVEENNIIICKSLILAVTAMIGSEKENIPLTDTQVRDAAELLDKAWKILSTVSIATQLSGDAIGSTMEPDFFFMYTLNAYDIQGRLNNAQSQEVIVKSFVSSKACSPKYLLQIGLTASQGPRANPEMATFALNECLSALLVSSSPDYNDVAVIIRRLIAIASIHKGDTDDDAVINMYRQACRTMVGLKEDEYPTEEGKWLAMTAWNRAAVPLRLGQREVAKKWMKVGLELARKISAMEIYRSCMEDFIDAFEEKLTMHREGSESEAQMVQ